MNFWNNEVGNGTHSGNVCAYVENDGRETEHHHQIQDGPGIIFLEYSRKARGSNDSNARTHFLNGCHQRKCNQRRPQGRETELGARLRIGSDAGGIIITRSGYQSRSEKLPESFELKDDFLLHFSSAVDVYLTN